MPATIEDIDFHGAPAVSLRTPDGASAVVSLLGGQVLSWQPAKGDERLFLSERALFDGSCSIRGGIPVCFPQFSGLGKLPKHGLLRTAMWEVRQRRSENTYAMLTLGICESEQSLTLWPQMFDVELTIVLDRGRLDVELHVENTGHSQFAFTAALHTYLRVREVEHARLNGLTGFEFRDATDDNRIKKEHFDGLQFDGPVNRVYHDVTRPLLLLESPRALLIESEGFPDVVVWNPWEADCAALPDMAPLDFRRMLCVEAAAARHKVALDAGATWFGRQTLIVQ